MTVKEMSVFYLFGFVNCESTGKANNLKLESCNKTINLLNF